MKKKIIIILCILLSVSIIFLSAFLYFYFKQNEKKQTLGVWWWDNELSIDNYLSYAEKNNITEIYYCDTSFDDNVKVFLNECNKKDIDVYLLDGNYKWLIDEEKKEILFKKLDNFVKFQNENLIKFKGVHLDIEPHQSPDFNENRIELITKLIELIAEIKDRYKDVYFSYDIPFWLNDKIIYKSVEKEAYKHIIDLADSVTIMSYRDRADEIYSIASEEIEYAKSINKAINLGIETGEVEPEKVTFFEEGKNILNEELNKLRTMIPEDFGIVVHHIKSWYNLKD